MTMQMLRALGEYIDGVPRAGGDEPDPARDPRSTGVAEAVFPARAGMNRLPKAV